MKKLILSIALASASYCMVSAQSSNVESAALEVNAKSYESAKKYIDKAAINDETKDSPKMHYFRGIIHLKIANDTALNKVFPDACEIALRSFIECIKLDTKKKYEERYDAEDEKPVGSIVSMDNSAFMCFDRAALYFEKKEFDQAMKIYDMILEAIPLDKEKFMAKNNLTATQIQLYYSYAAINAKNQAENNYKKCPDKNSNDCQLFLTQKNSYHEVAKNTLLKMTAADYPDPMVYIQLEMLQLAEGDTAGALNTISKGMKVIENNKDLINEELRIYQAKNEMNVLIDKLSKSISLDPTNGIYLMTRGNMYDKYKADFLAKKDYRKADSCAALAEADYLKCLEINSNDTFALYSLGALYLLQSNPIIEKINSLNEKKADYKQKLDAYKAQTKALYEKAKPHLEKAYELKQDDYDIAFALYQLYMNLEMKDKAMEFKKKKDELRNR